MEEEWKDIEGYEGLYQVSNLGRIKALEKTLVYKNGRTHHYKENIRALAKTHDGYTTVSLVKDKKTTCKRVSRIVAKAFLPNPHNYPEVNHIDEDKSNNKVSNLEWCSHSHNINHGTRNERVGNHFIKKVYQYSLDGQLIQVFDSLSAAARFHNYLPGNLSVACRKVLKGATCCGYFFSYEPLTSIQLENARRIKEMYIEHKNRYKDYIWLYKNDMNIGELRMEDQ